MPWTRATCSKPEDRRHAPMLLASLLVATSCATLQPSFGISGPQQSWLQTQRAGTDALDANKYWIAEPMLQQAVIQAGSFGIADLRLAKSLGELGRLYTVRGRFDEAEPYLEEELQVKERALGKDNGQTIPAMGSLVRFYLTGGTASKAEPLTEELLAILTGKLQNPLEKTQGKLKLKKGMPLEGWAGEAAPAERDPLIEWAITCDDLGELYRLRGNFDLADRLFKAALDMKSTVLGKEHLSLANSYDSLGTLDMAKNDNALAESYFKDALSITQKILPPESPEVYSRLDKLAKCLIKEAKYKQAEELYLGAEDLWRQHPSKGGDEARALFALGCLYADEKRYAEAARVLSQALDLAERFDGPSSIGLVPYLQKYAYCMYYLGHRADTEWLRAKSNTISGGTP